MKFSYTFLFFIAIVSCSTPDKNIISLIQRSHRNHLIETTEVKDSLKYYEFLIEKKDSTFYYVISDCAELHKKLYKKGFKHTKLPYNDFLSGKLTDVYFYYSKNLQFIELLELSTEQVHLKYIIGKNILDTSKLDLYKEEFYNQSLMKNIF